MNDDGIILKICQEYRSKLETFLSKGRGLMALHQSGRSGVAIPSVPFLKDVAWQERDDWRTAWEPSFSPADACTVYPRVLEQRDYTEKAPGKWRNGFALAYTSLEPTEPSRWATLATVGNKQIIIALKSDANVIVSAVPLDWARDEALMINLVVRAVEGKVRTLLLHSGDEARPFSGDVGSFSFTPGVGTMALARVPAISTIDLLTHVESVVCSDRTAEVLGREDNLHNFILGGGTIVAVDNTVAYPRLTVTIGPKEQARLGESLLNELAIADLSRWIGSAKTFEIRDLLLAIYQMSVSHRSVLLSPNVKSAMISRSKFWYTTYSASSDPITALTLALCELLTEAPTNRDAIEAACKSSANIERHGALSVLAVGARSDGADKLCLVTADALIDCATGAGLIRVLDAFAIAAHALELAKHEITNTDSIVAALANALSRFTFDDLIEEFEADAAIAIGHSAARILMKSSKETPERELISETLTRARLALSELLSQVPASEHFLQIRIQGALLAAFTAGKTDINALLSRICEVGPGACVSNVSAEMAAKLLEAQKDRDTSELLQATEAADQYWSVTLGRLSFALVLFLLVLLSLYTILTSVLDFAAKKPLFEVAEQMGLTVIIFSCIVGLLRIGKRGKLLPDFLAR